MRKDIDIPKVENVGIGIVPQKNEDQIFWEVYLINFSGDFLETVLISSKGFGQLKGKEKETATMRHLIEKLEPCNFQSFEGMIPDLTALTNQFWVSYYVDGKLFDKKFVFVPESINQENLVKIPILNKEGVLIV